VHAGAREGIIDGKSGGIISRLISGRITVESSMHRFDWRRPQDCQRTTWLMIGNKSSATFRIANRG